MTKPVVTGDMRIEDDGRLMVCTEGGEAPIFVHWMSLPFGAELDALATGFKLKREDGEDDKALQWRVLHRGLFMTFVPEPQPPQTTPPEPPR